MRIFSVWWRIALLTGGGMFTFGLLAYPQMGLTWISSASIYIGGSLGVGSAIYCRYPHLLRWIMPPPFSTWVRATLHVLVATLVLYGGIEVLWLVSVLTHFPLYLLAPVWFGMVFAATEGDPPPKRPRRRRVASNIIAKLVARVQHIHPPAQPLPTPA